MNVPFMPERIPLPWFHRSDGMADGTVPSTKGWKRGRNRIDGIKRDLLNFSTKTWSLAWAMLPISGRD